MKIAKLMKFTRPKPAINSILSLIFKILLKFSGDSKISQATLKFLKLLFDFHLRPNSFSMSPWPSFTQVGRP